jgi:hypothetical protein
MIWLDRRETSLRGAPPLVESSRPKGDPSHHELCRTPHARKTPCLEGDISRSRGRKAHALPLWRGRHSCRAASPPPESFAVPPPEPSLEQEGARERDHTNNMDKQKIMERTTTKEILTHPKGTKSPIIDARAVEIASLKPQSMHLTVSRAASTQSDADSSRLYSSASTLLPSKATRATQSRWQPWPVLFAPEDRRTRGLTAPPLRCPRLRRRSAGVQE